MYKKHFLIVLIVSVLLFIFDTFLKYTYILKLPLNYTKDLLGPILRLQVESNYYIAFSLPLPKIIILTLVPVIIVILIKFLYQYFNNKMYQWGIMLTIAGAVSNLVDRIYLGYVLDYFKIPFWPIFNLADVMIVVGVTLVIFQQFKSSKENKSKSRKLM